MLGNRLRARPVRLGEKNLQPHVFGSNKVNSRGSADSLTGLAFGGSAHLSNEAVLKPRPRAPGPRVRRPGSGPGMRGPRSDGYHKSLQTYRRFQTSHAASRPSRPGELDLTPNLGRTGSSGDAGSDFSHKAEETAGRKAPATPRPARSRSGPDEALPRPPRGAGGPAPFPILDWLW